MTPIIAALILLATPVIAGEQITGPVTHIRDGDTIEVAGVPIRLNGVAAPETHEPGGQEATAAMARMVDGKTVTCDLNGERSHDRRVGICYLDGHDIGAAIIGLGVARDCPRYSGGRYAAVERPEAADLPLPAYCR